MQESNYFSTVLAGTGTKKNPILHATYLGDKRRKLAQASKANTPIVNEVHIKIVSCNCSHTI